MNEKIEMTIEARIDQTMNIVPFGIEYFIHRTLLAFTLTNGYV